MAPTSYACKYCKKPNVAQSVQGLRSHISQSAECQARRDEEQTLLNHHRSVQGGVPHTHQQPAEHLGQRDEDDAAPPPDDLTDNHRSKRAQVDSSDDDDETFQSTSVNFIINYPEEARAGAILEDTNDGLETRFDRIKHTQQAAGEPTWAPFDNLADWELFRWLVQSGVSQGEIDKFLKLESVRTVFTVLIFRC